MQTLFIDRKNAELEVDRGRLLIRIDVTANVKLTH